MKSAAAINKLKEYPIAVVCALLLIVFVALIFLRDGVVEELSIKESELNSRINKIEQNIKNSNNIEQDAEGLSVLVEKIDSLLFDRNERAVNINFFYDFEERTDVVISDISQFPQPDPLYNVGGARKLNLHSTLVFNIAVRGSFSNILKFLYELDRVDSLIRVAGFEVSRGGNAAGNADISARLRVLVLAEKD
ncbi:MAG: hypothetical protein ACPGSB_02345 [Opitutales bacterium]